MDELRAEWLDVAAKIDAVDAMLRELAVHKRSNSIRAYELRAQRTKLVQVKREWEALIREAGGWNLVSRWPEEWYEDG